jgi:CDP-diacylglycerol--serine O-phosphatidyltransferase
MNMFLGLWAIMLVIDSVRLSGETGFASTAPIQSALFIAATWILIAGLLDGLDGAVARLTNTTSNFGLQFDSMSDLVTFGVAPATVLYAVLYPLEPGFAAGVGTAYAICGAVRLARFNVKAATTGKKSAFQGLPIPAAAGVTMAFVLCWDYGVEVFGVDFTARLLMIATLSASYLMISKVRFGAFSQIVFPDVESRVAIGIRVVAFGVFIWGLMVSYELLALFVFGGYVVVSVLSSALSRLRTVGRQLGEFRAHRRH